MRQKAGPRGGDLKTPQLPYSGQVQLTLEQRGGEGRRPPEQPKSCSSRWLCPRDAQAQTETTVVP